MICLADNDIIHKLAACDLLDDVLVALSLRRTDVYVLPTAKYKFRVTPRGSVQGERRYGAEVFARIRDFLASVREINVPGLSEEPNFLLVLMISTPAKPCFSQLQLSSTNIS